MPRKRRFPKLRRDGPHGFSEISLCERALWLSAGPLLVTDVEGPIDLYMVWPDWSTWATFYAAVRDEFWAARPWLQEGAMCEQLYRAWLAGADVEQTRTSLLARAAAARRRTFLTMGHEMPGHF